MKAAVLLLVFIQTGSSNASRPAEAQKGELVSRSRARQVSRSMKILDYRQAGGSARIDLRGTALLPQAHGTAEVVEKKGDFDVDAEFQNLQPASKFGQEYLTYVMWAITPQGRSINLGEALREGAKKLRVTTNLRTFGLAVTAEPYMAVTEPSDVVVMEGTLNPDSIGVTEQSEVACPLLPRGYYASAAAGAGAKSIIAGPDAPLQIYEARNAIQIARSMGAERYAPDSLQKAMDLLKQAEDDLKRAVGKKTVAKEAREAAETAEDARVISLKWVTEGRAGNQRRTSSDP